MDLSMPAICGYFMTMLFNPNNVCVSGCYINLPSIANDVLPLGPLKRVL